MKTDKNSLGEASDLNPSRGVMAITLIAGTLAAALPVLAVVILVLARNPGLDDGFDATQAVSLAAWLALAAGALWVLVELTQPGTSRGLWKFLLPAPLLFGSGIVAELTRTPGTPWISRLSSANPAACFTMIFLFSMPILSSIFYVLRSASLKSPRAAGAVAGLLASSLAAGIYLWHCPENSLLTVAIWHGLAVAAVVTISAYLGRRFLGCTVS